MWTVPNCITLFRVILIPVFVVVYFLDWRWAHEAGAFIFWLAAITDWFDGYLARKLQQSTPFGAFLDPVADKLIVGAALLMITHSYANLWITLPSIALLVREIYVSALREWMGSNGVRDAVKVSFIGKAKWQKIMMARNRKTMVLCIECHSLLTCGKLPDNRYLLNNSPASAVH